MGLKMPAIPGRGLLTGLRVTFETMIKTLFNPKHHLLTEMYPTEKFRLEPRARGVIALDQDA